MNFNFDLAGGVRYLLSPKWSLSLEYRWEHISNGNLKAENVGINAQGAIVGVSCFF